MDKIVLIDTNLYLDDANIISKLSKDATKILIPIMVLKELDDKKYHKELSYSARKAIQAILDFTAHNEDRIIFDITNYEHATSPDERILASAKKYNALVATKDISMSIIAKSMGLHTMLHDVVLNNIFNPYVHINMEALHSVTEEDSFTYAAEYCSKKDYQKTLFTFSMLAGRKLEEDCWWFVFIDVNKESPIIYANNPMSFKIVRIDDKPKYREIRTEGSTIKAKDCYQICAIYSMMEAPNVLICGSYGSGKSLLTTAFAMTYNHKKTFLSRPNLTVDRRFELGFIPGTTEEKLGPWMAGFMSSLYYIFSNTRGQTSDKMNSGGSYDFVREQVFKRYFEMLSLETLQGMSFLDGDLLLLDETQLCSISILSVILSRFGVGSKLIMTGDAMQTYGVIPPSESGLLKLLRLLPRKTIAYVDLKYNYRSELIEIADALQTKTF